MLALGDVEMASIYKRGKTWWIAYYVEEKADPIRRSLKTTNKKIALRERQAIEADLVENHRRAPQEKNPPFEIFWPNYIEWAESGHLRPRTIERKTDFWKQFMESVRCQRLGDVTPNDIEEFKRKRRKAGNAAATINKALIDLQAIYNRAIKLELFTGTNPFMKVDRYRETKKVPEYHSEEELLRLLDIANFKEEYVKWSVLLCGWAGLRKNELVNCRFEWFNFKRNRIRVRSFPGFTIKDHEEREIDMSSRIRGEFEPLKKKEGFVFESPRQSEGRARYRFDPKRALISALKEAELSTNKPFQRLRVTYGSILVVRGVPLKKVSRMLGHASVTTTEKHYLGLEPYDSRIDF
jgi:site-specific recombinase XerD